MLRDVDSLTPEDAMKRATYVRPALKKVGEGAKVLDAEIRRCEGCNDRILFNPITKEVRFF